MGEAGEIQRPPSDIIAERIRLWRDLGSIPGLPAIEVVRQASELLGWDTQKIQVKGALKQLSERNALMFRSGFSPSSLKIIYELGEINGEGINVLHGLASGYLSRLEQRSDLEQKGFIDEQEHNFANLAMVRLAELHRQGKYDALRLSEIRDKIAKVVDLGDQIIKNVPYLPPEFGWQAIWNEALGDPRTSKVTWRMTKKALVGCIKDGFPEHKQKAYEMVEPLYKAANNQGSIPPEYQSIMTDYFLEARHFGESYGYLAPEIFLQVIEKRLQKEGYILWFPHDVRTLFSREGVASSVMDLLEASPDFLPGMTIALIRSMPWVPELEYKKIIKRYEAVWEKTRRAISLDSCFSYLNTWDWLREGKDRILEWARFVLPHMIARLDEQLVAGKEIQTSQYLIILTKMVDEARFFKDNKETCAFGVMAPIVAERLINLSESGPVEVSFCGNLAAEVQDRVKGKTEEVFASIRRHLHISEVHEAAEMVSRIYSVLEGRSEKYKGLTKEDIEQVFSDKEIKVKMDLIREEICSEEKAKEKFCRKVREAVNLSFVVSLQEEEREDNLKLVLEGIEQLNEQPLSLKIASKMIVELEKYRGSHSGYLYPVIIAVRSYLLDQGVVWPRGEEIQEKFKWTRDLVVLGIMSGELLNQDFAFIWKRIDQLNPGNRGRAITVLQQTIKKNFESLNRIRNGYRALGLKEGETQDHDRAIQSRSMLDLLYRMTLELRQ